MPTNNSLHPTCRDNTEQPPAQQRHASVKGEPQTVVANACTKQEARDATSTSLRLVYRRAIVPFDLWCESVRIRGDACTTAWINQASATSETYSLLLAQRLQSHRPSRPTHALACQCGSARLSSVIAEASFASLGEHLLSKREVVDSNPIRGYMRDNTRAYHASKPGAHAS